MIKKVKSLLILMVGLVFLSIGQPVLAKQDNAENIDIVTPQAYEYLYDSSCFYTLNGTSIGASGTTQTYSTVDKITTTVYLEKKTSSGWSVVKSWTGSSYNDTYCDVSGSYTGTPGTTYRVRCYHKVNEGNLIETTNSYTSSFIVD